MYEIICGLVRTQFFNATVQLLPTMMQVGKKTIFQTSAILSPQFKPWWYRRLNRRESKPRRSDQFGIVRNSKIYPPDFRIQPIIADKEHSFYVLDALLRS